MPLFSTQQPPLSTSAKAAGASKAQILAIQTEGKTSTLVSNVLSSFQDQINQIASVLRQPPPGLNELGITDSNGVLIGWIGARLVGNQNYEGAWFANLWIGGTDPSNAIISIDGATAQIVITANGSIIIEDPSSNVTAEIGTIFDTPLGITSISNATPPVVTLASTPAIPFESGHSVTIKGNSVSAYNVSAYITVLTPTTFQLNGLTAHGAGTGGTCTRYFSGVYGQNFAAGGTNPWDANVQILDDGQFANITNTILTLNLGGITTILGNLPALFGGQAGLQITDNTTNQSTVVTQHGIAAADAASTPLFRLVGDTTGSFVAFETIAGATHRTASLQTSLTEARVDLANTPSGYSVLVLASDTQGRVGIFDPSGTNFSNLGPGDLTIQTASGNFVEMNPTIGFRVSIGADVSLLGATSLAVGSGANSSLTKTALSLNGGAVVVDSTHLTFTAAPAVALGASNGQTGTVALAKITTGGTDGSLTLVSGWVTAVVAPT